MAPNNSRKQIYCTKEAHRKVSVMAFNSRETADTYTMQNLVDAIFLFVFDPKHPDRIKEVLTYIHT